MFSINKLMHQHPPFVRSTFILLPHILISHHVEQEPSPESLIKGEF